MKPILPSLRSLYSSNNDNSGDEFTEGQQITVTYAEASPSHITVELTLDVLLSSAFQHSELPMALVAPHGEWLVTNPALCALLGYPSRQLCEMTIAEIAHEDDVPQVEAAFAKIWDGSHGFSLPVRFYDRNGEIQSVQLFASSARERGESTRFLLVQLHSVQAAEPQIGAHKVTTDNEITLLETRLTYLESELGKTERQNEILTEQLATQFDAKSSGNQTSLVDFLTGAYSLSHLERMLESEVARCNRSNSHFALIVCDIDYYSRIKVGCGEKNAEKVLLAAAQIFENRLRRADVLFRIGEDEFAMLLPNTSVMGAGIVANSLRKRLGDTLIEDVGLCSASFGVVEWSSHENGAFLLERAITTLQSAKKDGRNRVIIGEES